MIEEQTNTSYYVFITKNRRGFDIEMPATETIKELLNSGYWLLGSRARNLQRLKLGDQGVFYAAGRGNSIFVATATIASSCTPTTTREKQAINKELLDDLSFEYPNLYSFKIGSVSFFSKPVQAKKILDQLDFIKNRKSWGIYFLGGSTKISKRDFLLILNEGKPIVIEKENS